jgi:hypothetical protein
MSTGALLANSHVYDPHSGEWINEKFQRIAELIHELSPELSLVWIPPSEREATDLEPYAICHSPLGREPYIITYIKEDDLDERVIENLVTSQSDTLLERMHKMDVIREKMRLDEERDRMEQSKDIAKTMWQSPLHTYRINGRKYHL